MRCGFLLCAVALAWPWVPADPCYFGLPLPMRELGRPVLVLDGLGAGLEELALGNGTAGNPDKGAAGQTHKTELVPPRGFAMTTHLLGVPIMLPVNSDLPVSEEPLQGIAVVGSSTANSFEVRPGVLSSETTHYN